MMTRVGNRYGAAAGFGLLALLGACAQMGMGTGGEETQTAAVGGDGCGAEALQNLVGTSIGSLDSTTLPENRRVVFPGMAVTQDFVPGRLNVEVGADDEIARIYCG